MRSAALVLAALLPALLAAPAFGWGFDIGSAVNLGGNLARASATIDEPTEIALGEAVARKLLERHGLVTDTRAMKYLTLVGKSVSLATERADLNFTFAILDTPEVNAFACPGGPVFVTRGLWEQVGSEAELAGILGHELTHIVRRHSVNEVRKANLLGAVTDEALRQVGGEAFNSVVDLIVNQLLVKGFSRESELEADRLGALYAAKLGYYPNGLADFIGRCLVPPTTESDHAVGTLFSTHPPVTDRVAALNELTAAKFPEGDQAPRLADRLAAWRTPPAPAIR